MKRGALAATLLVALACGKKEAPPPQAALPAAAVKPWTCEILSGVLVVKGEVDHPVDLILEGRSIRETYHAEFGPVRWEMLKPPVGEVAKLRTAEGLVLAKWKFGAVPRRAASTPLQRPPIPLQVRNEDPLDALRRSMAETAARPAIASTPPPAPTVLPELEVVNVPVLRADLAPRHSPGVKPWPQPEPLRVAPVPIPQPPAPSPSRAAGDPWPGAGEALNLVRGPKDSLAGQRRMVLSFDGGSSDESAEEILDALRAHSVRTTIFLTGAFIQKFPDLVRRMAQDGHELGNHTMNHPHFAPGMKRDPRWTKERFQEELLNADRALFQVLGRPMDPYWRAPYGEQTKELRAWAEEIGFRHVGWSEGADTLDWATPHEKHIYRSGDAVMVRLHQRLARQDADGLIVLMHLGSGRPEEDRPSKTLGAFMDRAAREGWHFVRVSEYLQALHKPAWNPAARLALLGQGGGGTSARAALKK